MGKALGILFGLGIGLKLGLLPALFLCYIGHKIGKSFDDAFQNFAENKKQQSQFGRFYDFRHDQYQHQFKINIPIIPFLGILGHIAKSDGMVSKEEITFVEDVIRQLRLANFERTQAILSFRRGKEPTFNFEHACNLILSATRNNLSTRHLLFKWMFELAQIGTYSQKQKQLLSLAANLLELNTSSYVESHDSSILLNAHATLGTKVSDPIDQVKRSYRKLLGKHHPDRLPSNATTQQREAAAEKVIAIKKAFDTISQHMRNKT